MKLTVKHAGSFRKLDNMLNNCKNASKKQVDILHYYGRLGVERLRAFTPIDTGKTAMSWDYEIQVEDGRATLTWTNNNMTKMNIPVAILLQYGHATRNGYFVQGVDYINPALRQVFEDIAKDAWEEVTNE